MNIEVPINNDTFKCIAKKVQLDKLDYPNLTAWLMDVYNVRIDGTYDKGFYVYGEENDITLFLLQL